MSLLQPVKRARRRSLWLQEALAREPEAESVEPLSGGHRTDVCIAGGGYTGLWTALQIKWLDPSVDVILLEADICGSGASGRNGGFVTSWWEKLETLIDKYGEEEGMRLARESAASVTSIGRVCADYGIDADFRPGGVLNTATAPAHVGAWNDAVRATRDRGRQSCSCQQCVALLAAGNSAGRPAYDQRHGRHGADSGAAGGDRLDRRRV